MPPECHNVTAKSEVGKQVQIFEDEMLWDLIETPVDSSPNSRQVDPKYNPKSRDKLDVKAESKCEEASPEQPELFNGKYGKFWQDRSWLGLSNNNNEAQCQKSNSKSQQENHGYDSDDSDRLFIDEDRDNLDDDSQGINATAEKSEMNLQKRQTENLLRLFTQTFSVSTSGLKEIRSETLQMEENQEAPCDQVTAKPEDWNLETAGSSDMELSFGEDPVYVDANGDTID